MIKIEVHSTRAVIRSQEPLTVGLKGAKARFSFGEAWNGLIKTAVFRQGEKSLAVADVGTEATIPWEVLTVPGVPVQIGVHGIDSTGSVAIPTVWATTQPVCPGTDPEADPSTEPTAGLWEQFQGKMGSLEQLQTEDKSSLVGAINEVCAQVPWKVSDLENDSGYLTKAPVSSVNGQTGDVHITVPTQVSQLANDMGYLSQVPVTRVNGRTGDVVVPTAVKVTVTQQADGTYDSDLYSEEIVDACREGNVVYCQNGYRILSLLYAADYRCVFGCVHAGYVHTVTVSAGGVSVSSTPLASGDGLRVTDDGNGNVTVVSTGGITVTDDGDGNVIIG